MTSLPFKNRLLVGLTLFSMFFGAGNLIFPPFLGAQAGEATWWAMAGFVVTAVGFPILGVMAVAESGGLKTLAGRVHPVFAFVFTLLIYVSIGPALAIPRTAGTSFEMVLRPVLDANGLLDAKIAGFGMLDAAQALYAVLFFALAAWVAMTPEKLTQRLGKFLSPALITLIGALFIGVLLSPLGLYGEAQSAYSTGAFARGFIEGYQTMDTIAALNFGIIIAMNIRAMGVTSEKAVISETVKAGAIAALVFCVIYGALAHIGAEAGGAFAGMENGAQTLTHAAGAVFGPAGPVLMGLIFFIACLNTCVGLLSCCSDYFRTIIPGPGYRGWVVIFAVISAVVANAGLTTILKFSIPVLVAIYPAAIVLIVLSLLTLGFDAVRHRPAVYPVTVAVTGVVSVASALASCGLLPEALASAQQSLPLADVGLEWIIPAAAAFVLAMFTKKRATVLRTAEETA